MLIKDFYANREIFVTGGTGFLGKCLIEKLLRDCPKVKIVYLLLRSKKTLNAQQRLEELKNSKVFDRIRKQCPEVLSKLHAINGDSIKLGLGITPQDMELIKNVSIIFHMAANVKFHDALSNAILLNTRGTFELVKIAEKLKNLLAFVHCSTAYCSPFHHVVEEKVYKMPVDWRKTIKIAETFDEATINALYMKYTGYYPNTYTFTKNLSEQLINDYSAKLPMVIFRPSVVMSSFAEPVAGFSDNHNGPFAGLTALSIGVTPLMFGDGHLDCVPVDIVSRLSLVAAYKRGLQTLNKELKPNSMEVINCASGGLIDITMGQSTYLYASGIELSPMENCIWCFDLPWTTSNYSYFLLYMFFLNIPVSIVVDGILRLLGHEPLLLQIQRRIIIATKALMFFAGREYKIINQNMLNLENSIPITERTDFTVEHITVKGSFIQYFIDMVRGVKENLFNQPAQASKAAIKRYKILKFVNRTIKYTLLVLLIIYLWSHLPTF